MGKDRDKGFSLKGVLRETFTRANLKRSMIGAALYWGVYAGSGLALLPSGQEFLQARGVDPAAVSEMTGRIVRVREHNRLGNIHTKMGFDFKEPEASAESGSPFNRYFGLCFVNTDDESTTLRDWLGDVHGIRPGLVENDPLTAHEVNIAGMLHEFRHCSRAQDHASDLMGEIDSDYKGFWKAAQLLNNPEIITAHIHIRALNLADPDHDTVLYLDAMRRGVAPPAEAEIHAATAEVRARAKQAVHDSFRKNLEAEGEYAPADPLPATIAYARALEALLADGAEFSPLARRRAELFVAGAKYFMPSAVAGKKPQPAQPFPAR